MIESSFRPGDRARAIGAWSGLGGVAAALGPLLGGYLIDAVSWRAIFLINLPIGHRRDRDGEPARARDARPDARPGPSTCSGAALAAAGLAASTYALIEAPGGLRRCRRRRRRRASRPSSPSSSTSGGRANPMMPLAIFSSRQFSAANAVTFVVYAALGGFFFFFVSFLQVSLGYSPIEAGAASLPVTALMLVFSARSGRSRSGSARGSR